MEVKTTTPSTRKVEIEATVDELAMLFVATRPGRRTKEQLHMLAALGDSLRVSDNVVKNACNALDREDQARKASSAQESNGDGEGHGEA